MAASAAPPRLSGRGQVISVLDADPDLADGLAPDVLAVARRHATARMRYVPEGPWDPVAEFADPVPRLGLLVVDGLLTREVSIAGRTTTELLGAGDLLRPWDQDDSSGDLLPTEITWMVHEPLRVAVLDKHFAAVAGRWPALVDALVSRSSKRLRRLATRLAIGQVTRVDERLLILLWQLAERWGRVGPDGVRLPLPLTHETLGKLVGARRPSVTTALSGLARDRLVERTADGWLLRGEPVAALEALTGQREPSGV
jgi:hypothetical protein